MTSAVAQLNRHIDAVWRMGDRDECSTKHIAHALAAMASGDGTWTDGVDYRRPWSDLPASALGRAEKRLGGRWAQVEALRAEIGAEAFRETVLASKVGFIVADYLDLYWA
jgi:hypothetical protein